jgi:hypothetical protein
VKLDHLEKIGGVPTEYVARLMSIIRERGSQEPGPALVRPPEDWPLPDAFTVTYGAEIRGIGFVMLALSTAGATGYTCLWSSSRWQVDLLMNVYDQIESARIRNHRNWQNDFTQLLLLGVIRRTM